MKDITTRWSECNDTDSNPDHELSTQALVQRYEICAAAAALWTGADGDDVIIGKYGYEWR